MAMHAHRSTAGRSDPDSEFHGIMPSQYLFLRRPDTPERLLMIAVLRDAWDCIEKYRLTGGRSNQVDFVQAMRWIRAHERQWPFSFERVCEVLEIDTDAVRERLEAFASSFFPHAPAATVSIPTENLGPAKAAVTSRLDRSRV